MTESDIQDRLFKYFNAYRGYTYQLCNTFVYKWESDFWCLSSAGYAYEIEVKISRQDFFNDFNKEQKHTILSSPFDEYNQPLGRHPEVVPDLSKWEWEDGYWHYTNGRLNRSAKKKPPVCKFKRVEIGDVTPNRFLYAVPDGMLSPQETPTYAGLIHIPADGRKKPSIISKPPAIHTQKNDYTKILLKKYYWAYLNSLGHKKHGKNFRFPDENRNRMVRTK